MSGAARSHPTSSRRAAPGSSDARAAPSRWARRRRQRSGSRRRWSGTNASRTTMSLLPVPRMPDANQVSTISQSDRGQAATGHRRARSRARRPSPTPRRRSRWRSSSGRRRACRPAAGSARPPAGLMHVLDSVSGPPAKYSSWAAAGKWPSHQLCTIHSEHTHAVEPHAAPQFPADRVSPRVEVEPVAAVAIGRPHPDEARRHQVLDGLGRDPVGAARRGPRARAGPATGSSRGPAARFSSDRSSRGGYYDGSGLPVGLTLTRAGANRLVPVSYIGPVDDHPSAGRGARRGAARAGVARRSSRPRSASARSPRPAAPATTSAPASSSPPQSRGAARRRRPGDRPRPSPSTSTS